MFTALVISNTESTYVAVTQHYAATALEAAISRAKLLFVTPTSDANILGGKVVVLSSYYNFAETFKLVRDEQGYTAIRYETTH